MIISILIGAAIAVATPTPVEIWTSGDTGEVQRLADSVRSAFAHSSHFVLSSGHKPGTLYVSIPDRVTMRSVGNRVEYSVSIRISQAAPDSAEQLSTVEGIKCWEDDLDVCGQAALARVAKFPVPQL